MKTQTAISLTTTLILSLTMRAFSELSADSTIDLPYRSLFRANSPVTDVYLCSIRSHTSDKNGSQNTEYGKVDLHIVQTLRTSNPSLHDLKLAYWIPIQVNGFEDAFFSPAWRNFAQLPPNQLILVSFDSAAPQNAPSNGLPKPADVIYLTGPDDPTLGEAKDVLSLSQLTDLHELDNRCQQLLQGLHGIRAMRAAVSLTLEKIAPHDPAAALQIILFRSSNSIPTEEWEFHDILNFLSRLPSDKTFQGNLAPRAEILINLCSVRDQATPPAALHLIAQIAATDKKSFGNATRIRRTSLLGILADMHPTSPEERDDIKTINATLLTVPDTSGPRQ